MCTNVKKIYIMDMGLMLFSGISRRDPLNCLVRIKLRGGDTVNISIVLRQFVVAVCFFGCCFLLLFFCS